MGAIPARSTRKTLPPMTFRIGLRKADIQQGLSYGDDLARVKSGSCRTVEVRAKPDLVDTDEIADMRDCPRHCLCGLVEQIAPLQ